MHLAVQPTVAVMPPMYAATMRCSNTSQESGVVLWNMPHRLATDTVKESIRRNEVRNTEKGKCKDGQSIDLLRLVSYFLDACAYKEPQLESVRYNGQVEAHSSLERNTDYNRQYHDDNSDNTRFTEDRGYTFLPPWLKSSNDVSPPSANGARSCHQRAPRKHQRLIERMSADEFSIFLIVNIGLWSFCQVPLVSETKYECTHFVVSPIGHLEIKQ